MKPDHAASLPDDAAVAGSAPAPGFAGAALRLLGLALAVLGYLGAASLLAIAAVRVGADLMEGINPFQEPVRRPYPGMARLAARELAVDIARQLVLVGLVLGLTLWRYGAGWRTRLALDGTRPNGMRARTLLLVLLLWPVFHIAWVTGTAEAFGAAFGQGVHLSPALGPGAVAAWLLYAVVLAPVAEECLMRGEAFAQARGFLSPIAAILVTAGFFAAAHLSSFGLARPVSLLPLALMLGWLRWRTGRLWPCICLHGWSNLALIAYLLWPGLM